MVMTGVLIDVVTAVRTISSRSGTGRRDTYWCLTSVVPEEGDLHTVADIDPGEPKNMSVLLALELAQAAPQSFCLNDVARLNMLSMFVTLDTSHFEMSPSNDRASRNILFMLVTLEMSHFEMLPLNVA